MRNDRITRNTEVVQLDVYRASHGHDLVRPTTVELRRETRLTRIARALASDHYARLSAAKHLREFLLAGRPVSDKKEYEKRRFTLDEIEAAMQENELERSAVQTPR